MSCEGTLDGLPRVRDWLSISESRMMSMRKSKTKLTANEGANEGVRNETTTGT